MKTLIQKIFFLALILASISSELWAKPVKLHCPKAKDEITPSGADLSSYEKYLSDNKIILKTEVDVQFLEEFIFEYEKFPQSLREELIKRKTKIHLIQGSGVTADPTWKHGEKTFDGRTWSGVPGSGGTPNKIPTRIVVNHLNDNHGSVNLVLHEHGHTLDNLYATNSISKSRTWKKLLSDSPEAREFLGVICGSYCQDNINEGFAELFAYYHACEETKAQVEGELPMFAEFLRNLNSVKDFRKSDKK